MDEDTLLYACCPKCTKPLGRLKRCDGLELRCPKCGSKLRVVVGVDAEISTKLIQAGFYICSGAVKMSFLSYFKEVFKC